MTWTRQAVFLYPSAGLTNGQKDALAQAFVDTVALETFANERLMFDKAAAASTDYGLTETHRQISTQATPALATALQTALAGVSGLWYLIDAASGDMLATNDPAKTGGKRLDYAVGVAVVVGEILRFEGQLIEVLQPHTTAAHWHPFEAVSLYRRYRAPGGDPEPWVQPGYAEQTYPLNFRVTHNGKTWRSLVANNSWEPGAQGSELLWQDESTPQIGEWVSGEQGLQIGDLRTYQGATYRVRQNPGINIWPPPTVPALWELVP